MKNLIEKFVERLKILNRSESTIARQTIALNDFIVYLEKTGVYDICSVRQANIIEYQKYRKEYRNHYGREDGPEAQNRYLEAVKQFFIFLKKEGITVYNPAEEMEYIKEPKRLPKPALTFKEIKKILNSIDIQTLAGYRDRTILEILYSSGIRRFELQGIKLNEVDYNEGFIRVHGKGDKDRVVPMGKTACQHVENYINGIRPYLLAKNQSEYLFTGRFGKMISKSALDEIAKRYISKAGIKTNVTTHTFRRSCATGMIRNNANVMMVKELLGHASMSTINRYVNLTAVDLKKEHQKTHPREVRERT